MSFAVLCLKASPDGRYLAAATDTSRHIILEVSSAATAATSSNNAGGGKILRNLYGHSADCYSSPVIAWSANGQYLYSNTQDNSNLLVYEIASGKLIDPNSTSSTTTEQQRDMTVQQQHHRPIKDIFSSPGSDLLVTTSFDRKTVIWFPKQL